MERDDAQGCRSKPQCDDHQGENDSEGADPDHSCNFLLYIVAFLDRINIGFAALTMNKELAITGRQYGLVSGIFFIGYFLFEIPSNLLLHKIGARIWIARILVTWGAVATLTGFVHSVHQLYAMRFVLGLAEAGYFPESSSTSPTGFPSENRRGRLRCL